MSRARFTVPVVTGLLLLAFGVQAGRATTADSVKRSEEARQWAAEHPDSCALLDNPQKVSMMDSLLLKLAVLCGRDDLLGGALQEANEGFDPDALGTDVRANNPNTDTGSSRTQSETSVSVNETTGMLCAGYNDSFHGVTQGQGYTGFSSSNDGGVTWVDHGALGSRSFGDPGVVWRKMDGQFYFVALDTSGLGIWRSTDDCQTFAFLSNPHVGGSDDKELMAIDNNPSSAHYGRIYVAWTNFTTGQITVVTSDNGTTWSSPVTLSGSGLSVQGAWPAVAPNGDVYVDWVRWNPYPSGPIDIELARSTNGGSTFSLVTDPMTGHVNPRDNSATSSCGRPALNGLIRYLPSPQVAVGPDGAVHVVYSYDPDGNGTGDVVNVYYRRSNDNGATWGTEVQLNDDGTTRDQWQPTLSVGATNVVSTGWYDRRNDAGNLRFQYFQRMSFDGGVTFGASTLVSDADSPVVLDPNLATCYHGDYDTQIQTPSAAVLVWSDDRGTEGGGNNPDVWTDTTAISSDFLVIPSPVSQAICAGSDADVNISVPSFSGFTNPVTLSVSGNPGGTSTSFTVNPVTPPGSSVLTIGNTGSVATGSYPMTITGTSGAITHDGNSTLNVYSGNPGASTLVSPADGATGVPTQPTFSWTAVADATSYLIEVDDNSNFSSPEFSATVTGTSVTSSTTLTADRHYYWRVTANNPCGSTVSAVFQFDTALEYCISPGLAIPDNNPPGVNSDMSIANGGTITDLNVSLVVTHTWVGDLRFTLTHVDTGTSRVIDDRPGYTGSGFGCSGDDIDATIDDEGVDGNVETQCDNLPATHGDLVGGDPPSTTLLAGFDGESLTGTWRLNASDNAGGDTGTVDEWCLVPAVTGGGSGLPFNDGFESGDTSAWSLTQP
jgi:hypothetical protein